MLEICRPLRRRRSSLELINYAFPSHSSMAKSGGMSLCLCGKLHILVVFGLFEFLSEKSERGVHCDVNAHACLHGEPFIFNPTLTQLFWLFSGGRLAVPLHVIMCAAVQ